VILKTVVVFAVAVLLAMPCVEVLTDIRESGIGAAETLAGLSTSSGAGLGE
jgi:hypothetical protein